MKNKFRHRSAQDELLDSPNVSPAMLLRNLKELDFLNRTTGGHATGRNGVLELLTDKSRTYHIVDLGCGSGDWLRYMAVKAKKTGHRLKLTGVDKNPSAIEFLNNESKNFPEIEGFAGDSMEFLKNTTADIFYSSLFCHHLSNVDLVKMLALMKEKADVGFVINDLERTPLAYYGAILTTNLLGGSVLSRHDGPLSVLKGFTKHELLQILDAAGINSYVIYRRLFFRFLVVGHTSGSVK